MPIRRHEVRFRTASQAARPWSPPEQAAPGYHHSQSREKPLHCHTELLVPCWVPPVPIRGFLGSCPFLRLQGRPGWPRVLNELSISCRLRTQLTPQDQGWVKDQGAAAGHMCLAFKWVQAGTPSEVRGVPIALTVLCRSLSEITHSEFEYEG